MNVRALAVGLALVGVAGCDPCFGVSSCSATPRVAIEGTVVEHFTGQPSPGVRIDVIRSGGVALARDSSSTLTGADGHWQMKLDASEAGDVVLDINVHLAGVADYRVRGLHVSATDRNGEGLVLPTWVVNPYFAFAAELFYRATQDTRVEGATVDFHRTSGIDFALGSGASFFTGTTDAAGRLLLFGVFAHSASLGDVIGDLVVHLPPPFAPDTVHGLHLGATQLLHAEIQIIRLGVGPSLQSLRRPGDTGTVP